MELGPLVKRTERLRRSQLFHYHRNVYLMLLFTLGKGLQLSIAALTTNLYLLALGYHSDFIGLVTAVPAIGALLAAIPIGLLADRWGRKPLLLWSGMLNPLALAAIALSTNPVLLVGASLMNGLLSGGYWVTNLPVLTESTSDDQRVGVLSLNSFLLLGVGALGGLVGGLVPELVAHLLHTSAHAVVPLRWGVLSAAVAVFLPVLPLFWLQERAGARHTGVVPASSADATAAQYESQAVEVAAMPHAAEPVDPVGRRATAILFAKLLIPDVLFTTSQGAVFGLLQVYLVLRFRAGPGSIGLLYTAAGLIGGAMALTAPRLVRHWGGLRTAILMQYLSAPAMLLTGLAPTFPLAASGEFARNIFRGFFDPVYASFTMGRVSRRLRATLSGFYSVTWSIGATIGPGVAGVLQQHVSLSGGFYVGAACVTLSATLLWLFFGRTGTAAKAR
jgi:MFS family permease